MRKNWSEKEDFLAVKSENSLWNENPPPTLCKDTLKFVSPQPFPYLTIRLIIT